MSTTSKQEYLREIRSRYQYATKEQKSQILDEFCSVCGYNRKYAIRLLNGKAPPKPSNRRSKRGRKPVYNHPFLVEVLREIWIRTNLPCAKRLKAIIPLWLPYYDKFILPEEVKQMLLNVSAATIDRILSTVRAKYNKKGLATTKPGSILKKQIPIKTNQWDETTPGFLEADTVAHCDNSTAGMFVYTLNTVDIATGWTEQRAVWGKGEQGVLKAIKNIEASLPFSIKGFDCDNGSEFLNWHLKNYWTERKRPVQFTRARAYHKNDNAHIESKNWTHIRQYIGYQRFEHRELTHKLNELYTSEWNLYFNFFIPSVKLISKNRIRSKIIKVHDDPKTPLQRLIDSEHISEQTKAALSRKFEELNPFHLENQMTRKIKNIIKFVNKNEPKENQK